jgi:hypothetical protein
VPTIVIRSLLPITIWLIVLVGVLFASLSDPVSDGDHLIRNTIRLALLYYAIALTLLLRSQSSDWREHSNNIRLARLCWTLAWLTYIIHVAIAFHFAHHWSHAEALRHTEEVSGVGEGIFVSHLFTLVWTADVVSWRLWPGWYARRAAWLDWLLHGFMLFVVFNATVVFESGWIRWAGVALFAWLAVVAVSRRSTDTASSEQVE